MNMEMFTDDSSFVIYFRNLSKLMLYSKEFTPNMNETALISVPYSLFFLDHNALQSFY